MPRRPTNHKCGIYAIEQSGTGRFYIGSSKAIYNRWSKHRRALDGGVHHAPFLQAAWKKHGEESFSFFILEECAPEELWIREQAYFDTFSPVFNANQYAQPGRSNKGKPLSEKARQNVAAAIRARAAAITYCPHGHEYTPENTYTSTGTRICKTCARRQTRRMLANQTPEERRRRLDMGLRRYYDKTRGPNVSDRWSKTHRARISAGLKGRVMSPQTRAKIAAVHQDHPWTAARRAAYERRWQTA